MCNNRYSIRCLSSIQCVCKQQDSRESVYCQTYGPRREKTCLWGVRQSEFQTSLFSYRDFLVIKKLTCSKFNYDSFQTANNKGTDQTARMCRLVCACVVHKLPKTGFLESRPISVIYFVTTTTIQLLGLCILSSSTTI